MQFHEEDGRLIGHETPGCSWLFALFFVVVGILGLMASNNRSDAESPFYMSLLGSALSLSAVGVGFGYILKHPEIEVILDGKLKQLIVLRHFRGLARRVQRFHFNDIREVLVLSKEHSEGGAVYKLGIKTQTGSPVALSSAWQAGAESIQSARDALANFLDRHTAG